MQRRKFIAGLGSLTAAGAAGIGTGAFSSVSASRGINVDIAGDASAFLSIEKTDDPNADYVTVEEDGSISLQFDGSHAEGNSDLNAGQVSGLNTDSFTQIGELFDITNRGTQDVFVYMLQDPDGDDTNELGPGTGLSFASKSANDYFQEEIGGTGLLDTQTKEGLPNHPVPAAIRVDVGNTMADVGAIFGGYLGDIQELDMDIKIVAEAVGDYDRGDEVAANDEEFELPY